MWADEADRGQEEGLKDRPVVVVVASITTGERTELLVAPVTHSPPRAGEGIEIPSTVKRHLGLDTDRSWVIATELNRFTWPGPDLRLAPGSEDPYYGTIPAALFEQIRSAILTMVDSSRLRMPKRTE